MRSDPVYTVTDKYLKANPKKTWLARISMILMVALLTCVFTGKDTVLRYMGDLSEALFGSWHYAFYNVNQKEYQQIRSFDFMKETAVSENLAFTEFQQSSNTEKPFLNIRYYSAPMFEWNHIQTVQGRLPENENEIVISKSALDDGADIQPGDQVEAVCFRRYLHNSGDTTTIFPFLHLNIEPDQTVLLPDDFPYFDPDTEAGKEFLETHEESHEATGFTQTFTVSGVIETPSFESADSAAYTAISFLPENALPHADEFNGMCVIDTERAFNASWQFYDLLGADRYKANNQVLAFSGNSSESGLNAIVIIAQVFFLILISAVSIILIYNTFQLSYDERRTYLGMLSSIGATAKQKRSSVYYESFTHLKWALPCGLLLGFAIVYGGVSLLKPYTTMLIAMDSVNTGTAVPVPLRLSIRPVSLALTVLFSVLTVLLSSLIPARRVSKIGAIDSIRGNDPAYRTKAKKKEFTSAESMVASALNTRDSRKTASIIRASSAFLIILFVISYAASQILQMVEFKLVAGEQTIERPADSADVQLNGNEKRFGLFVFRDSDGIFPDLKAEIIKTESVHDIDFYSENMFAGQFDISHISDEYRDKFYELMHQYTPVPSDSEIDSYFENTNVVSVYAVSDEIYREMLQKTGGTEAEDSCILYNRAELSTKNFGIAGASAEYRFYEVNHALDYEKGQRFIMHTSVYDSENDIVNETDLPFEISAVTDGHEIEEYVKFHTEYPWLIIPESMLYKQPLMENASSTLVFTADTDNPHVQTLIGRLQELSSDEYSGIYFSSSGQSAADAMTILSGMIRVIMICFAVIVSIISLLNIFNSISALYSQRKKMNASLESVGMTRSQLRSVYRRELMMIIFKSILLSLPVILLLSWIIHTLMMSRFGDFTVKAPYVLLSAVTLLALAGIFLVQEISFRLSSKTSLIEQIRSDFS